jgi:hypothetical protein
MTEDYKPFILKAHLLHSVAFDTRFGVGLDSLLASSIRKKEKAYRNLSGRELDGGLSKREVEIIELPLAKCIFNTELWHWDATMGVVSNDEYMEEVGFIIQHTDIHALEQTSLLQAYPTSLSEKKGRYRARKTPIVKTLGQSVIWHGIGSPEAVYELVKGIPSIGQRRTSGEGTIQKWTIETVSPENLKLFSHSIDSETLARPCADECLETIEQESEIFLESSQQRVGYRPPYWHFGNIENLNAPPLRIT